MSDPHRIDRRMFAGALATTSTAAISVLASSFAAKSEDKPASEKKEEPRAGEVAEKPATTAVELLLLKTITQQYPSEHYDDAALQGIYRDLRGDSARGRILSEFALKNGDEPAFVFKAFRSAE